MIFRFNIGLKLYSTDVALIQDAVELQNGLVDFIELYVIPGSHEKTIDAWKSFDIPYVIHAPHSLHGVNLAQEDKWQSNLEHFNETRQFADELGSDTIIVHGGNNGSLSEAIRQIRLLNEPRIALENKPKIGLQNELCIGWLPVEFRRATESGVLTNIVLDFAHAACAAHSLKVNEMEIIRSFMAFNPKVFHLSDGDALSEKDVHLNLGKGSLNLTEFLSVVPDGGLLTVETPRDDGKGLEDFSDDVHFLRNHFAKQN
ncbi:MAG: sugar phosphate isomerase/epimerase family protein [Thermodesulfobacteriota bacterium]